MRSGRRRSLIDFAIAASVAVVPILVGVLLALDRLAPAAHAGRDGDRHVSVRQVAALKTFEAAIVRRDRVRAPARDADSVLDALPECRADWSGSGGWLGRARSLAGLADVGKNEPARRVAKSLRELDEALVRFGAPGNRRVADAVGFDLARWAAAARQALATPVDASHYPERRFDVRCADLAAAAAMLARSDGRMLHAFAWRGSEVDRTTRAWQDDQYVAVSARHVARANPWGGLAGCIYLGRDAQRATYVDATYFVGAARAAAARACASSEVFDVAGNVGAAVVPAQIAGEPGPDTPPDDARWQVPPSLGGLVAALEPLQRPSAALYRALSAARPNRVTVDGALVDVGYAVELTIDPALQALAQKVAACYTGRHDVCDALAIRRAEDGVEKIGRRHLEQALVRMAAVAIVDVRSGRIDALAGAMTPCAREEFDGPGRSAHCDPRLPYPIRYRPDALMNAAVFHDAMPASIVKPVMAAAFLSDPDVGARWLAAERASLRTPPATDSLRGQLMRSDSARFLDRMFCADRGFAHCERIREVQAVSGAFGWNAGCERASERCGKRDLLFGRTARPSADDEVLALGAWVPYGRLLVEPSQQGAAFRLRAPIALDAGRVRRCALGADGRRASRDDWEKCSGGVVVDVVAEGWGQGHARASALGAAGMMAALAGAANRQPVLRRPHLVEAVRGVADVTPSAIATALDRFAADATEANTLSADAAEVILGGLTWGHRQGTSRRACEQVFDAKTCREIDWIAGKTGTPTFPNDDRTLDEIRALCAMPTRRSRAEDAACGALRPYKWFVAAYRTGSADAGWTKAIAVLTERNWVAASGRVHGAGDHGPNPAAEIALQIAGRHVGALRQDAR